MLALKTGLGGTFIGVLLVSLVTSLPELFTGISSVTFVGAPDLTIGNLLGANTFNLLNLAVLDILSKDGLKLHTLGRGQLTTGIFGAVMVAVVGISILLSNTVSAMSLGHIGWYTPVLIVMYIYFAQILYRQEKKSAHLKKEEQRFAPEYRAMTLRRTVLSFTISAIVVIGAGVWLAMIGEEVAVITGLRESFVGSLFLAFATTLPEITVSYTALRIGATDIAVANMVGSSVINMFIVSINDIIFLKGPILAYVLWTNLITAAVVVLMTALFIARMRYKAKRWFRFDWWNSTMIVLFVLRAILSYAFSSNV